MPTHGHFDPLLVALSVGVATFASFTALNLTGRLVAADRAARGWWLLSAAMALGGGIWAMHFVGMLAFTLPVPVSYDVRLTAISLLLPIAATALGLYVACKLGTGWRTILSGGLIIGLAVVTMHYTGMAAMRMPGIVLSYVPWIVALSVAIAIVAATAALWLAFRTTQTWQRLAAAALMGVAIAGMHYTAMAAAEFRMDHHVVVMGDHSALQLGALAVAVVGATVVLLLLALITAFFDRKLATLTAHEAEALRQSEERHRSLIENASDIIAILDRDGSFVYESSSALNVLGYRTSELVGRRLVEFVPEERAGEVEVFLKSALGESRQSVSMEVPLMHSAGTWRDFEVVAKNLLHLPTISGLVVNMRDITERKQLMAQLETLSETDLLTGVFNRRGFMKFAAREFERARRAARKLAVVMLDIDHFKAVNDRYGHAAGDLVLAMIAEEGRRRVRSIDLFARIGGEEFAIILVDGDVDAAHGVLARMREGVARQKVSTIKGDISVTASFGIAVVDPGVTDVEVALRLADEALYEAKNSGRNCIKMRA